MAEFAGLALKRALLALRVISLVALFELGGTIATPLNEAPTLVFLPW